MSNKIPTKNHYFKSEKSYSKQLQKSINSRLQIVYQTTAESQYFKVAKHIPNKCRKPLL